MTRALCAIDTESSSLAWKREAWEIALVRRDETGTSEVLIFLDVDLKHADGKALEIGGYFRRHPRGKWLSDPQVDESSQDYVGRLFTTGGPEPDGETYLFPDHAARIVHRMTFGATIVGAQPHFDTHILERLLRSHLLQPAWHYRLRDVESMTAGALGEDVGGLAECAAALGLSFPEDQQHTALGDARMALAVYDKCLEPGDD